LGMDTRQVIARFEAERQALALMDHPGIAKVLDAGATETGRPYFVMELVQGVSITEYCDKNSLTTKDRLALFLQVCSAVQHAHQKGIIHRDIKPSNVMVTHHDGQPIPKVIDFGIAKATNQKLTEKTLFTRYAHLIGTPAYMSPEQAELSDLDIDTRSDIYSLGVLLYELLTGTTPFSEEELRKAGYVEMQRVIREQEPVRPSTKLSTLGGTLTDVAKSRNSTPELLRKAVRGDLDWIVMKSLEKDRARRYETASGLAEDIRRHLAHEPVVARGPSTTYRLRKFLRRHCAQAIAALAVVLLAGAAVAVLSLWNRDRLQLAEAEGFRDRGILSQAREQYAKADRDAALETIQPILHSKHVGPEARLLQATILVDNRHPDQAATILNNLLNKPPEIAGAAHSLLARILWETGSPDAEKLNEIEEHRRQAETLLPDTAEAYFLRAMTGVTVKEQLAALDRALQLDPAHYEARRLRTFTYYASRKYERMKDDATVMTVLRPRDPLGHSLHAVAWRELGHYREAMADYDVAIALTPQGDPRRVDLSVQRCETLRRLGEYRRVIAEAKESFKLSPDKLVFRYYTFCALTALGEYENAASLFREIVTPGPEARRRLQDWCIKSVFDTLEAGQSWHPADHRPEGAAFLPMVEAEETYRNLSAKARRVTTDGFGASWSPDGKRFVFSVGVQGYSGVAIFDLGTKETDLLIVPGKDARWSPDGKYIAFVRDCRFLRVSEFIAAECGGQRRAVEEEEVWIMNSDGTRPRRLAGGGWPSWSQDSTYVYYHSRMESALCSISVASPRAEAKQIMACVNLYPSVSPDNQRVAVVAGNLLKIKDLTSKTVVAEQPVPFAVWGRATWSPTGQELCLGGRNDSEDRTGLWIHSLDRNQPMRILDGQVTAGSWAPDGTKLAFCLGPPYFELWAADLSTSRSTIENLGRGQTSDEYSRQMIAFYSRRIEADTSDADACYGRAQYYQFLHEREKADADLRRFSSIVSRVLSSNSQVAMPKRLCGTINGIFGYQVAFSVGGRKNGMQVLCVALGQKGRCEMRVFEIPMVVLSLLGISFVSGFDAPLARADFTFGQPTNLGVPINTPEMDATPSISADGLSLYFASSRPGGFGGVGDIWMTQRATRNDPWSTPVNLGPVVNSSAAEASPSISADGLSLFFCDGARGFSAPQRPGGLGGVDLWVTTRTSPEAEWQPPLNLGPTINSTSFDAEPAISSDGLSLYFESERPGGYGGLDIYVASRATRDDPWGTPVNLGPPVNSGISDAGPSISMDGRALFFHRFEGSDWDLWMATRRTPNDPWGPPVKLPPGINSSGNLLNAVEARPTLSPDGATLYFCANVPGGIGSYDLWQVPIIPVVDFNGDGKLDLVDLVILIDDWGRDNALCDIGPMPWGDGKVDIEDLKVFMTYYEKENPPKSQDGK
jgi:Tol biopolymer transport system component/tetratricopeptide (TPR) repeat protein